MKYLFYMYYRFLIMGARIHRVSAGYLLCWQDRVLLVTPGVTVENFYSHVVTETSDFIKIIDYVDEGGVEVFSVTSRLKCMLYDYLHSRFADRPLKAYSGDTLLYLEYARTPYDRPTSTNHLGRVTSIQPIASVDTIPSDVIPPTELPKYITVTRVLH